MATTLTFLGGARTVTGSKYLLSIDPPGGAPDRPGAGPRRILVDCGLFQGMKKLRRANWAPFPVDPASIDDVLLTHAHMDHTGYLPRLVKHGFRGSIWGTDATQALTEIVLRDSAYLQERDADFANEHGFSRHEKALPLYRIGDVAKTLPLMRSVEFHRPLDLGDGIEATWYRAGHILGSASIRVATPDGSVLFSGDLGRTTHPVLRSREIPPGADVALIESTYGDREHIEPASPHEAFATAIRRTVSLGGSVLVPAFAVDRTEVVLAALDGMAAEGRIPPVPVYVDSPMALRSLEIYRAPSQACELRDGARLRLPHLRLTQLRTVEESKRLNTLGAPAIIISASGMATGGPAPPGEDAARPAQLRRPDGLPGSRHAGAVAGRRRPVPQTARHGGRRARQRGPRRGVLRPRRRLRAGGLGPRPVPRPRADLLRARRTRLGERARGRPAIPPRPRRRRGLARADDHRGPGLIQAAALRAGGPRLPRQAPLRGAAMESIM